MFNKKIELEIKKDGVEEYVYVNVNIGFDATMYTPAKTSGRPENCYPAEGGNIDFCMIKILDEDKIEILGRERIEREAEIYFEKNEDEFYDHAIEVFEDNKKNYMIDRYEREAEDRMTDDGFLRW
jgi:hypothetical protein